MQTIKFSEVVTFPYSLLIDLSQVSIYFYNYKMFDHIFIKILKFIRILYNLYKI
jgi:hypothetical protein